MKFNYKELGLIAGLECHQQLDTGKLFCRCPTVQAEDTDKVFDRKLRIVASELNKLDPAMVEQFKKDYLYEYSVSNTCNCLIEADEEPVKPADNEALDVILKVALMCNSRIFPELFVMRKIVIDGSNVSGFQRTMLVSEGGEIELRGKEAGVKGKKAEAKSKKAEAGAQGKRVGVQTIVLEEDAAVPREKSEEKISYSLQRLGIPLIELATEPDLRSPEEVKECALKIGELFRRTCRAKRGLGTIRQDVNVSIRKGARVELKGIQELGLMDRVVEREIERQVNLVEIKKELEKRGVSEKNLEIERIEIKNLNSILTDCESKVVKSTLGKKKGVYGVCLKGFAGLLGKDLQGERRFGTELANFVKVKNKIPGLFHSDELPAYGISEGEKEGIGKELGCAEGDAFVLLCGNEGKVREGFETILARCEQALKGVPGETRNVLEDGCSEYMRPLPGAARMYPETDLEGVSVGKERLERLKKELPLRVEERQELYRKHGLSEKLVEKMKLDNKACFFEKLLKKGFNGTTATVVLLEHLKRLERATGKGLEEERIEQILEMERKGKLIKDLVYEVMLTWSKNPKLELNEVIKEVAGEGIAGKEIEGKEVEKKIAEIVKRNEKLVEERKEHAVGALMGEVMKEFKGKISGKEASELLLKEIRKVL